MAARWRSSTPVSLARLFSPPPSLSKHIHLFVCLSVCYIDGSEVEKFYPSQLGAAVLSSSLPQQTYTFVCLFVCLLYRWQRGGEVLPQSAWRGCSLLLPPSAIHVHLFVCLFVCCIDGSEVEKFYPSQLGAAVLSSSLPQQYMSICLFVCLFVV